MSATNPSLLTIVTACDERYARCVAQLLLSVERHRLHLRYRVVVYDLGLRSETKQKLAKRFSFCTWRTFLAPTGAAYFLPSARTYAWKPWVIADALGSAGRVLWLDSATVLHTPRLTAVEEALNERGIYLLRGKKSAAEGCDRAVLAAFESRFGAVRERWHEPILVSGVVAIDQSHRVAAEVVKLWCEATLCPELNLPPRLQPGNAHSADQSLLTLCVQRVDVEKVIHGNGEIDISSPNPERWMSSRHKLPVDVPLSADPLARAYYRVYKKLDRVGLRAKGFWQSKVFGVHRFTKEHFTVTLDGKPVASPPYSYLADPFTFEACAKRWLFVEWFDYSTCRGSLIGAELPASESGQDQSLRFFPVLSLPSHLSFPFVFHDAEQLVLLPESRATASVDLYVSDDNQPTSRWHLKRRLLANIDAVDSVCFFHQGRWWLLTSVSAPGRVGRSLALFSSPSLWVGEFEPHPINRQQLYADRPHGFGRNGGSVFLHEGHWCRLMQASQNGYGEGTVVMRMEISLQHFAEHEIELAGHDRHSHHVCRDSTTVFVQDRRDRWPIGALT